MEKSELKPIIKPYHNQTFSGIPTDSEAVRGEISDLSLMNSGHSLDSVWKCKSIIERLKFLLKGELTLRVLGQNQPPVALIIGDIYEGA